jgi:DNA adenine methylase
VVIENREAADVMLAHDGDETVHYVDPPYVATTRDKGSDYRHEMTDADHEALAETLHGLRGAVMLSGYRCPMYDRLYSGWRRIDRAAHADGARDRVESLWLSHRCPAQEMLLFEAANAEITGG